MEKNEIILVTGGNGFVGKNLISTLKERGYQNIIVYSSDNNPEDLIKYTSDCSFVFHLAGVNRPQTEQEFLTGNRDLVADLFDALRKNDNKCPVLISSSIQAEQNNPYGLSKKAGEIVAREKANMNGNLVYLYRLPNLFGKWSRPNYNSVIATFCYNISRDQEITINDPEVLLRLCHIDDVVEEFIDTMENRKQNSSLYLGITTEYEVKLGHIVELLQSFKNGRVNLHLPDLGDAFTQKLYSTYISFLPQNEFKYPLKSNSDERGSFTEIFRTGNRGQLSVNISKPGVTKGNHWHHTKHEKFLVVSGKGVVRFRNINDEHVIEYFVDGDKLEVIDIIPGHTHNIENLGDSDLITIMWANECFDPEHPDTYFQKV